MNKRKGFTLVELLVVISIIALLLAILMPSLARARDEAKSLVCKTNLKQLGQGMISYVISENNGYFPIEQNHMVWIRQVTDYIGLKWEDQYKKKGYNYCPKATKFSNAVDPRYGGTFAMFFWGYGGSYGINRWLHKRPSSGEGNPNSDNNPSDAFWQNADKVKQASNVPMFSDATFGGIWARASGPPPDYADKFPQCLLRYEYPGQFTSNANTAMYPVCINRHNRGINSVFVDQSVRKVRLKELWTLKWGPKFNTNGLWTEANSTKPQWPAWMK